MRENISQYNHRQREQNRMAQDYGAQEDEGRLYFLSERKLYELAYKWINTHDDHGTSLPHEEWIPQFLSPLQELSLRGAEIMNMVQDVADERATVVSVVAGAPLNAEASAPSSDAEVHVDVVVSGAELPVSLVFLLPITSSSPGVRKTPRALQSDVADTSQDMNPIRESNERYDLVEVNRTWNNVAQVESQLRYKQALAAAQAYNDALILRYYNEALLPPGKRRDTLEWLNPHYALWQESFGFYFRGLFFETNNVIEVPGEQGSEQVPAEIFLATTFQVERDGRSINSYRPFGQREDAIAWVKTTNHVKANITRLVPDPSSTNWFVLSDLQNLNPLGYKPQGEIEWLN